MTTLAVEDGLHAAKRAAAVARRDLLDLQDDAAYRIKRDPLKAVGIAFAAGLGLGVAMWALTAISRRACSGRG